MSTSSSAPTATCRRAWCSSPSASRKPRRTCSPTRRSIPSGRSRSSSSAPRRWRRVRSSRRRSNSPCRSFNPRVGQLHAVPNEYTASRLESTASEPQQAINDHPCPCLRTAQFLSCAPSGSHAVDPIRRKYGQIQQHASGQLVNEPLAFLNHQYARELLQQRHVPFAFSDNRPYGRQFQSREVLVLSAIRVGPSRLPVVSDCITVIRDVDICEYAHSGHFRRFYAALRRLVGRISTSAGIPSFSCSRRIMLMERPRRPFSTSATRVRVPRMPSKSLRVRPCCSMRNLMASIGSGESIG